MGLRNVVTVYEKLTGHYTLKSLSDIKEQLLDLLPPEYILDIRSAEVKKHNDCVIVSNKGYYPSDKDTIITAPFDPTYNGWYKCEAIIQNAVEYNGIIKISTVLSDRNIKILLQTRQYNELSLFDNRKIIFLLMPINNFQSLTMFFEKELNIHLDNFDPKRLLLELFSLHPKMGLHYAFRHRDLHCQNCLTSRSNFKIIDVADSENAPICTDIARLEISLLIFLINQLKLSTSDVELIIRQLESNKRIETINDSCFCIAKLVISMRNCFYHNFSVMPTDFDISFSYFWELCNQISYSIISPRKIGSGIEPILSFWKEKLIKNARSK